MSKIIGFISLFAAFAIAAPVTLNYYSFVNSTFQGRFEKLWHRDISLLRDKRLLPKEWESISNIEYSAPTPSSHQWLEDTRPPLSINKNGEYSLEVVITDWKQDEDVHVIIQYNLIHNQSGNMIWELGRTFNLGKAR